jgi:hypothetical protein
MIEQKFICDLCGLVIDHKNTKFRTFSVPGMVDVKQNEVIRYDMHFCESHDFISLMLSHSEYELNAIRTLNVWLKNNRWKPMVKE